MGVHPHGMTPQTVESSRQPSLQPDTEADPTPAVTATATATARNMIGDVPATPTRDAEAEASKAAAAERKRQEAEARKAEEEQKRLEEEARQAEEEEAEESDSGEESVYYANCAEARAAGAAPLYRGEPGYAKRLDRDNDGDACE